VGKIKTGTASQVTVKLSKQPAPTIQEKIVIEERIVEVPVIKEILVEKPVEVIVEKLVEVPVETVVEKIVEVPMVQEVFITKEIPVEVIVEKKIIDIEKLLEAKATIQKKDRSIAIHRIIIAILIIVTFIGVARG
jgi:hypothetical protein